MTSTDQKVLKKYGPVVWLVAIAGFELVLAESIPDGLLTQFAWLAAAVEALATVFPSISNFDEIAAQPEVVRLYLAISTLLMVPKVYLFVRWLDSDYLGTYRHLVISPLTRYAPRSGSEFLGGGSPSERPIQRETGQPRSAFARFVGSLFIVTLLLALVAFFLVKWGDEVIRSRGTLRSIDAAFSGIATGGFRMWLEYEPRAYVVALLAAIAVCILRDYWRYLRRLFSNGASQ